ncbi:uncharacterized protein ccdc166 isoform X1 [Ictalurus punctatus]|uniref:Uncharacterized protein ccdc166 isoform X1 n=1 Tax=Ictalurus punctatus TaxID=7998 RepID=A0A2D0RBW3_ICTPU|nr:uncharacterized protein ccdc166 isoform X1 [Ictalurus punctatus]
MAPKKQKKSKASGGSKKEEDKEKEAEREAQLHREYESLTETLINLKKRKEQLRRDNEVLQREADQICMDSQEYKSYMSKRAQKRQNASVTLTDPRQQRLEELSKQREEMVEKHKEWVNGLKNDILEKETELAMLNLEITKLEDVKSLQQQQLDRIAELKEEVVTVNCHHCKTLHTLKAKSLMEKERYKAESKRMLWEVICQVNKDASVSMLSYIQQVTEENFCMYKELQQLIQRAQALRSHQQFLQTQRRQILLEKKCVQELQRLRTSTAQGGISTGVAADPAILDNNPCFD